MESSTERTRTKGLKPDARKIMSSAVALNVLLRNLKLETKSIILNWSSIDYVVQLLTDFPVCNLCLITCLDEK